jgi:hypothetical protein
LVRVLAESPVCRVGLQVSEERPRWVQLGWVGTGDHREAGQRTMVSWDHLGGLEDLQGTLHRAARNTGVGCPSLVSLVETWVVGVHRSVLGRPDLAGALGAHLEEVRRWVVRLAWMLEVLPGSNCPRSWEVAWDRWGELRCLGSPETSQYKLTAAIG